MKVLGRTGKVAGRDMVVSDLMRIGAAPDNEFRVLVAGISRHHARVVKDGDTFWLEDAGSTNGTFLNGQRIARERLRHLDVITLGRDVDLITVVSEHGDAGAQPLPRAVEDAWLEAVDARDVGRVDVPLGEITLGRLAPANVLLDSPVVSHLHARIRRTADHVIIQDLDSANGTFVNGTAITEATPLADGDTLAIAGSRHFRVHVVGNARRAKATETTGSQPAVFDPAWQTRLVWSADELSQLEAERKRILDSIKKEPALAAVVTKPAPASPSGPVKAAPPPAAKAAAAAPAPAKPAASPVAAQPAKPAVPPAEKPAAGAVVAAAKPPAPPEEIKPAAAPVAAEPKPSVPAPPAAAPVVPKPAPVAAKPAPPPVEKPAAVAPPVAVKPAVPPPPAAPAPMAPALKPAPAPPVAKPAAPPPGSDAVTIAASPFGTPTIVSVRGIRAVKLAGDKGTFTLDPGRHTVGRSDAAGVPIIDPQVSRAHAVITVAGLEARVEDAGSSNGTFVNSVRVPAGGVALNTGDRLGFGSLEFTVELMT